MTKSEFLRIRRGFDFKRRIVALLIAVVCISAYWISDSQNAFRTSATEAEPEFWTEITGSDKDGFDLFAKNSDEQEKSCTVKVTVTLDDGSTKSYEYSRTVRKTDKMSFGGEAGLKPAPIKSVEISSKSCS